MLPAADLILEDKTRVQTAKPMKPAIATLHLGMNVARRRINLVANGPFHDRHVGVPRR